MERSRPADRDLGSQLTVGRHEYRHDHHHRDELTQRNTRAQPHQAGMTPLDPARADMAQTVKRTATGTPSDRADPAPCTMPATVVA